MNSLRTALTELQSGQLDRAAEHCDGILASEPGNADALSLMSFIQMQRRDWATAHDLSSRAIAARPNDSALHFNRGMIAEQQGDHAGAETDYIRALRLDPTNIAARINLGGLYIRDDRLVEAEACYRAAVDNAPNIAEAHAGLGIALKRQNRNADAVTAFRRALALRPDDPEIISNLGWALSDAGGPEEALPYLRRAVAARPRSAVLWANLASALMCVADWGDALSAVDQALDAAPIFTPAIAFLGVILDSMGETAQRRELVDFDAFMVQTMHTRSPDGFADMDSFNAALARHVTGHPTLLPERPGKTTRNGSQTANLIDHAPGPISALVALIESAIAEYLRAMPDDRGVFRTAVRPRRWRTIAWATVLHSEGHQAPHHHPAAWISGVYYAAVPPEVGGNASDNAGWIEFGRPVSFADVAPTLDLRLIRPREGLMLLFPSYFWHRTLPFVGERPRISIAFDVVPVDA